MGSPPTDRLLAALDADDEADALAALERCRDADVDARKATLRALRERAEDRPDALAPLFPDLTAFLTDDDRAVRLTAAKLFASLAAADPGCVRPVVPALAERLADHAEFRYVRARSAEAIGRVAVAYPTDAATPDVVADLLLGLDDTDDADVAARLALAAECVARGDPSRLRHHAERLAGHLDGRADLVRYHLCTALVAIGTAHPDALADVRDALVAALADDVPWVRARAAEALGLLPRAAVDADIDGGSSDALDAALADDPPVAARARFALGDADAGDADDVGTVAGLDRTTADAVAAITEPDGECPNCGLALPEAGPPMCPRCGAPY
ncbi:hypothetical protein J2752_001397 [Halarchaeum rubridurum]|uniref:HEAT repeat-containing protein n=1 Tax=Halarchaeum rubridurum TaxID=489911 RepID=A0A830FXP2_9EURY|nr:HEAT repeat domain-containing protein [Halarchaeum rubridurum]MBP1954485.1 hypothetical protein [Halarchaeum rubridurum]GGM61414.1 hypothetical protein GCM10009017_09410 [Halarchaeum rubridurum]